MSGFSRPTRLLVYARAQERCERCGVYAYGGSVHHRRPRGMGGSKQPATNGPANALLLCGHATSPDGCHQWVENHRADALDQGLLVLQSQTPAEIPVQTRHGLVRLDDLGNYIPLEGAA